MELKMDNSMKMSSYKFQNSPYQEAMQMQYKLEDYDLMGIENFIKIEDNLLLDKQMESNNIDKYIDENINLDDEQIELENSQSRGHQGFQNNSNLDDTYQFGEDQLDQ